MDNFTRTYNGTRITVERYGKEMALKIAFAAVLIILFILSMAGGIFVCYVLKKKKMYKKKCWLYLLLLQLSDMAASFFSVPILVAASINENILEIRWACCYSGSVGMFFGTWQIYAIAAISVHRYRTIVKPLESLADRSYSGVAIYLLTSLVISSFFAVSPILGFGGWRYMKGRQWCVLRSENGQYDRIYSLVAAVFGYTIPLCIIIVSAVRIYFIVKKQFDIRQRRVSKVDSLKEQSRLANTLSLLIGSFIAFWTPSLIYFVFGGMARLNIPLWYSHLVFVSMFLQNCCNPVIYCLRHNTFRDELKRFFSKMNVSLSSSVEQKLRSFSTCSEVPIRKPSSPIVLDDITRGADEMSSRNMSVDSILPVIQSNVYVADDS